MGNFTTDMVSVIVVGFSIVFCVLAMIYGVMLIMKVVFYDMPNKKAAAANSTKSAQAPIATPAPQPIEDEAEIAAVIAVIAAAMNTDASNIKIHTLTGSWQPTFKNNLGGNVNEKLYSKDKWKNI